MGHLVVGVIEGIGIGACPLNCDFACRTTLMVLSFAQLKCHASAEICTCRKKSNVLIFFGDQSLSTSNTTQPNIVLFDFLRPLVALYVFLRHYTGLKTAQFFIYGWAFPCNNW